MRKLIIAPSVLLRTKCSEIDFNSSFIKNNPEFLFELRNDMINIMQQNGGVGLAAPQVAVCKRMIVVQSPIDDGVIHTVINPVATILDDTVIVMNEGCLSYPGRSKSIKRPSKIRVDGLTINGENFSCVAEDLEARIFLHEIDHLNGKCALS